MISYSAVHLGPGGPEGCRDRRSIDSGWVELEPGMRHYRNGLPVVAISYTSCYM